jgi:hypothetical protein
MRQIGAKRQHRNSGCATTQFGAEGYLFDVSRRRFEVPDRAPPACWSQAGGVCRPGIWGLKA